MVTPHGLPDIVAWRHPRPHGAPGRCIGRTDLPLDRRKARRLAHRIRREARRQGWPRIIHTSPLTRCAMVGRQLRQWGWRHHIDPSLLEMDFGTWDGRAWAGVDSREVQAWCDDFLHGRPGLGESLSMMFERVAAGLRRLALQADASATADLSAQALPGQRPDAGHRPCLIVAHGGWMQVARWLAEGRPPPTDAAQWPRPPAYGVCWHLPAPRPGPVIAAASSSGA